MALLRKSRLTERFCVRRRKIGVVAPAAMSVTKPSARLCVLRSLADFADQRHVRGLLRGPTHIQPCFFAPDFSRAYRILATILANLSCSRESHSGGFTVLTSA
jgi:hypothetical protein